LCVARALECVCVLFGEITGMHERD